MFARSLRHVLVTPLAEQQVCLSLLSVVSSAELAGLGRGNGGDKRWIVGVYRALAVPATFDARWGVFLRLICRRWRPPFLLIHAPSGPNPLWTGPWRWSRWPVPRGDRSLRGNRLLHHMRDYSSPLSLPIDRERSPRNRLFRFLVSEFRAVKSFDCKTVLLPFYAFTSLSNFIIETSSTFWITRGLWRRFNVETTTTVLYTRFTFQFWNTVGKLSKRKSKFEYWLNAEGKSFLKYLLKTAFSLKSHPSNLHRFNRGTLS